MIGRRSVAGLLLFCALLFCALAAQGASAKGTTAVTCSPGAGVKNFSDAHCDKEVSPTEGSFGQIPIEAGQEPAVEITNGKTKNETKEATPAVLKGTVAGVSGEVTCNTVGGSAKAVNKEIGGVPQVEATAVLIKLSSCTVNKPTKCTVKEPIEITGSSLTVENQGAGKTEMGLEFKPNEGKPLTEITFQNSGAEVCSLKSMTFKVEGTLVATGSGGTSEAAGSSGGTLLVTNAMSKETLKLGGKAAELSTAVTVGMSGEGEKPLTLATPGTAEEAIKCGKAESTEEECEFWESLKSKTEKELAEKFVPAEEWTKESGSVTYNPILFVHGFTGDVKTFQTMVKTFKEAGYKAGWLFNWSYEWWKSNTEIAKKIEEKVNTLLTATGASKVDIISHSMGGLSSRYYVKELKGASKVDDWVSLGGPNHGAALASVCAAFFKPCGEMVPGSTFLKNLNASETPAGPTYGTWRSGKNAGGQSCDVVIQPPNSVEIGGTAKNTVTGCITHYGLTQDKGVFEEVHKFVE